MDQSYDVVVVGSGFGGAITATRLAQAGRSVCVLERGKRWDKRLFPRSLGQVADHGLWREGHSYGFIEYNVFRTMDVIHGVGVGGGSLHYFNVHLRTPEEIFRRPGWPARVTRATLDPYYDIAEDMLGSARLSPPRGYGMPPRTLAFQAAAEAAGRRAELVPIGVYTGEPRPNPHSGVMQEGCDYSGDCLLGCRLHAKNTLDITYLALGEKRHGLEIRPLHQVEAIAPEPSGGYRVIFDALHPDTPGGEKQRGQVIGKQVVIAGGTLGSTHLLLRCRDVAKTLPGLSPMLGQRFSGNGDMIFGGTLHADRFVDPGQGPSITAGADLSRPGSPHRIYVEDCGFPNPFMWLLEGQLPSLSRTEGLIKAFGSYVGAAVGVHSKKSPMQFKSEQLFAGERTARFLPYLGMGTDAGDGVLRVDASGDLELDWDNAASKEMFIEMEDALQDLSRGLGGTYLRSFLWDVGRLLTAHPLGGCPMGDSAETGVVDDRGEVHGYPGLFVADGAIIPGALSVNPSLTISALAERAAYWMIHGEELAAAKPMPANA